jgi:hypothetical protein
MRNECFQGGCAAYELSISTVLAAQPCIQYASRYSGHYEVTLNDGIPKRANLSAIDSDLGGYDYLRSRSSCKRSEQR